MSLRPSHGDSTPTPVYNPNTPVLVAIEKLSGEIRDVKRTVNRIADDHLEMRTGIPTQWGNRALLVGLAAAVGAMTAGCVQYLMR